MSEWVDNEYALKYFMYQRNFKQHSAMPLKLNCSCPICGDSESDSFKSRFWYYDYKGEKFVHCFNCDYSAGFGNFLKEVDEDMYRDYQLEKFKNSSSSGSTYKKPEGPSEKIKSVLRVVDTVEFSTRLDKLNDTHPIIKYVKSRKIPESAWDRLWFTDKWQDVANSIKPGTFENPKPEYRLVIPIYNKKHKIEAVQGRALGPSAIRYMTVKTDENSSKIYGLEKVDDSLNYVFIMEGPIDSLFLNNAIAMAGGSMSLDTMPYSDKRIWVLDNEPRHIDTLNRMEKLIDSGEKVCFWDEAPWSSKDINDMIKNEDANAKDISDYILNNSFSGIMAKLRFANYRKV